MTKQKIMESIVKDIKRNIRSRFCTKDKIRIVLEVSKEVELI